MPGYRGVLTNSRLNTLSDLICKKKRVSSGISSQYTSLISFSRAFRSYPPSDEKETPRLLLPNLTRTIFYPPSLNSVRLAHVINLKPMYVMSIAPVLGGTIIYWVLSLTPMGSSHLNLRLLQYGLFIRMNSENIAVVALWVGSKPLMDLLFQSLNDTLSRLSVLNCFKISTPEGTKFFSLRILFGIFDLIAKAPAINMVQHNGEYDCSVCLHYPGESFERRWIYVPGKMYTCRSKETFLKHAARASRDGSVIKGIKGGSLLSEIIDLSTGIPIDYMHCVLEGVTKHILQVWATSSKSAAYIGPSMTQIDKNLLKQRPPHDFSCSPRSIVKHRKYWKASEFRNFIPYLCFVMCSLEHIVLVILDHLCQRKSLRQLHPSFHHKQWCEHFSGYTTKILCIIVLNMVRKIVSGRVQFVASRKTPHKSLELFRNLLLTLTVIT